jgi:hypothetical protein
MVPKKQYELVFQNLYQPEYLLNRASKEEGKIFSVILNIFP